MTTEYQRVREELLEIIGNIKVAEVIGHSIGVGKFADSILRLTQPLPEIPLAKVPDRLQDFGEDEHIWNEACETQLDLCLETLRKAGYEEKK